MPQTVPSAANAPASARQSLASTQSTWLGVGPVAHSAAQASDDAAAGAPQVAAFAEHKASQPMPQNVP